ncbi:MAG TPA: hypothetical protein VK094_08745 [Pseudogracilibacillus sp.]|nr:hypothetical protein [Pseudogracilibacillus sp.]
MTEIIKLIEYAELSGFPLSVNQDKLRVANGSNLPYHLKQMLQLHKKDIIRQLGGD